MIPAFIKGSINFSISTGKSRIHGKGAFATQTIPAKRKIGSLAGELISRSAARKKATRMESVSIVELWNGLALDATEKSNDLKYINHSCSPNTYMRTIGNHVEFYTLRRIRRGEELTCHYGETHHEGKKTCRCGAAACKGYI